MAGGRSGEDKSQTKRKLGWKQDLLYAPRWVLFHVAWVLMVATIKGKKSMPRVSKKRKNKKTKSIAKEKRGIFFKILYDQRKIKYSINFCLIFTSLFEA